MYLVTRYLLSASVNSYENAICEETIIFTCLFRIFDLKIEGPFQDLLLKMGHFSGHFQDKKVQGHFQDIQDEWPPCLNKIFGYSDSEAA